MDCPKCDRENNDQAEVCIYCHSPLCDIPATPAEPDVRTSQLAVASCILGVLGLPCFYIYSRVAIQRFGPSAPAFVGLFLISAILAVLLGVAALGCIEFNYGRLTGRGFAATGIAIPLVAFFFAAGYVTMNRPRSVAYRLYCGTNLSGIGKAMLIYANDYDDELPRAGGPDSKWGPTWNWQANTAAEAYGLNDGPGQATISANFYLLVKYAEITPKSFVCKGDKKTTKFTLTEYKIRDKGLFDLWDFGPDPSKHCSYTYHLPYGKYPLSTSSDPGMAVAANRNPWLRSPGAKPRRFESFDPTGDRKAIKAGNTPFHRDDGQNVLFIDGHVSFEKQSFCGLNDDNIYTSQNGTDIRRGTPPTLESQPADANDSLLVHDPPIAGWK